MKCVPNITAQFANHAVPLEAISNKTYLEVGRRSFAEMPWKIKNYKMQPGALENAAVIVGASTMFARNA